MPHCIIEYSSSVTDTITLDELMTSVHTAAKESALFDVNDIKTRAIAYADQIPAAKDQPFIHVCTKLLSGRSIEQRQHLSRSIFDKLSALRLPQPLSLTVEIVDIDAASYSKEVTT